MILVKSRDCLAAKSTASCSGALGSRERRIKMRTRTKSEEDEYALHNRVK